MKYMSVTIPLRKRKMNKEDLAFLEWKHNVLNQMYPRAPMESVITSTHKSGDPYIVGEINDISSQAPITFTTSHSDTLTKRVVNINK